MNIPWDDLKMFLAVAETGSMSRGAKRLGVGQPTISRRLAELESELGHPLFRRSVAGVTTTSFGERLMEPARKMAEWAAEADRAAAKGDDKPRGVVRIAAAPGVAWDFVAPFAAWLRGRYPDLTIEALSSIQYLDLGRGEADLALRMREPERRDQIVLAKLLHHNAVVVSKSYAKTLPKRVSLADLRWIAWAPPFEDTPPNPQLREMIPDFKPAFTSDNFLVQWSAAEAGVGAIIMGKHTHRFSRPSSLVPLSIDLGPWSKSALFLVCSKSSLEIPRVRVVADALSAELARIQKSIRNVLVAAAPLSCRPSDPRVLRPSAVHRTSLARTLSAIALLAFVVTPSCTRQDPPGAEAVAKDAPSSSSASFELDAAVALTVAQSDPKDDDDAPDDAGAPSDAGAATEIPTGPEYEPVLGGEAKLAATATQTWVYVGPNDETQKLGYLRAGAIVDRGEKAVAFTKRCKKGWFRVAPRGFVCNGKRATTDVKNPIVVASWKPPARGAPLPYLYGRTKEVVPMLYVRVPTVKEMERSENIKLAERLALVPKESMLSLAGEITPLPPFLADGQVLPKPFGATSRLHVGAHEGKAGSHSAFAFMSVHEIEGRLFGLSTDMDLIALDRVNLVRNTPIHGGEIQDLPAGIINSEGATLFHIDEHGGLHELSKMSRFDVVSLTGLTKGDLWETRDGNWVNTQQLKLIKKRDSWPSFVKPDGTKKWIDVSIHSQMLIAYEGTRAVYVAQVSTGIGEMGDPEKTHATKRGTFTIKAKHMTGLMNGDTVEDDYELNDVPYVQYFENGYALHAAFWHERFGHPQSHGCVNLPPKDAAWLFEWTEPEVPKEWHGAQAINGEGTIVNVRY